MSSPPTAIVLGATGHIGCAIARHLIDCGYAVTAATRQRQLPANLNGLDIAIASGDADHPGQLSAWIAGHDVVLDAAAPYPIQLFCPTIPAESRPLDYAKERTRALLEAARIHRARLVLVSSFVTLPRPSNPWQALRSRMARAAHPYFAVKSLVESLVLQAARAGLPAAVINPTMCLGPWDMKPVEQCLVPQLLRGQVMATATDTVNVVDVREVARVAVAAIEGQRTGVPIAVTGHNVRIDALMAAICQLGDVRPPRSSVPTTLGALMAYWTEAAFALSGRPSPYPSLVPMLLGESYPMALGYEQRELGVMPRPLEDTLRAAMDWYRAIGYC